MKTRYKSTRDDATRKAENNYCRVPAAKDVRRSLYLNRRPESSAVRMLLSVVMATPAAELMRLGTPGSEIGNRRAVAESLF